MVDAQKRYNRVAVAALGSVAEPRGFRTVRTETNRENGNCTAARLIATSSHRARSDFVLRYFWVNGAEESEP